MIHLGLRELLEEKTGVLLLITGGFLLVDLVSRTLPDLVGVHRPQETTGMGWLYFLHRNDWPHWTSTTIHCFVGLYHRLTSKTPRLTVEGGALMALTPILFVSGLLTMLIQPLPELPNLLFLSPLPYTAGKGLTGWLSSGKTVPSG